jgi:hypothetical protein
VKLGISIHKVMAVIDRVLHFLAVLPAKTFSPNYQPQFEKYT